MLSKSLINNSVAQNFNNIFEEEIKEVLAWVEQDQLNKLRAEC